MPVEVVGERELDEGDTIIINHDDAKPEDVAEAEAAVKVSGPEDATDTIGSFLDGSAESLPSSAIGIISNFSDAKDLESDVLVMGREDAQAKAAVTEDIPPGSYDKAVALDLGVPSPPDSLVYLEIKDTIQVLELAGNDGPLVGAFSVDSTAQENTIEATEELTTTFKAASEADTPSIESELVYPRYPPEEISNKITAEDNSKSPDVTLKESTEEMTKEELAPVQPTVEPGLFVDKSASEIAALSDSGTASIITASVFGGAAVIGAAAAIIAHSSNDKPPSSAAAEEVGEPTVSMQVNEEFIMEPAPQTAQSPVHGIVIPEADVKQALEDKNTAKAPVIVVSSPPASPIVGTSGEVEERTVEVIGPTPGGSTQKEAERESGEIFSHPVWNQSITPFLHFSLENTVGGLKKRPLVSSMAGSRPVSSGNDTVSTKHQKNMMRAFWNVIFFGWLGGFGRILSGMFGKSKKAQRNAN